MSAPATTGDEGGAGVKLSRQRCIYGPLDEWERIRRRARKAKLPISRFGYLCCRRAADEGAGRAPELPGHSLVLAKAAQGRLAKDALTVLRSGRISVHGPGDVEAVASVWEAVRFLCLAHDGDGA